MSIDLIPPIITVLEDRVVTTSELDWLIREFTLIMVAVVVMTGFWKMVDKAMEMAIR